MGSRMADTAETIDGDGATRRRRLVELIHTPTTARLILALAIVLTISAWYFSHAAVQQSTAERFEFRTEEIETAVVERLIDYEGVLWSGVAMFNASDRVTRQDWAEYVATLNVDERWPGIQGIGWSIPVAADELAAHEAEVRAEGFPDYVVRPEDPRDEYSAILYLEPFDWRNQRAFGYDMWSNAERRQAMARARDTGEATRSAMITLVQETDEDVQRGFLIYTPVYEGGLRPTSIEARREQLRGWVYAPFRMEDLMDGLLGSSDRSIDYEVFDGEVVEEDALLYDSQPASLALDGADGLTRTAVIGIQGHPWTVVFSEGPAFTEGSDTLPTYVAIAGMVIDLLLFYVISSLGLLNRRANAIAEGMTAELRLSNEKLEERSVELERQAVQLRRTNDELRQFAHVASHDLQEPLRTMGSYSSLMASTYDDVLDDEGRRWLGYINTSARRLSDLIREILQFSTVDELHPDAKVDLNEVVAKVVDGLSALIDDTATEIVPEHLPIVAGDPVQLERLLSNLVSNAIKYRQPGRPAHIEIGSVATTTGWRIHVRDEGVGIPEEYQDRVFDVFRRVGDDTASPGTGMGLAICRKIAQGHGGDIGVESTPGEGSEFWFTLPRTVTPRRRQDDRAPDTAAPTTDPAPTSGRSTTTLKERKERP